MKITTEETRCPKCGSGQTYVRVRLNDRMCQKCGRATPLKKAKDEQPK